MENDQQIQQLNEQERRELKRQRKEAERKGQQRKRMVKRTINIILIVLTVGGGIFGIGWFVSRQPYLPPTAIQGHIEQSPPSHIVTEPIPENIQKHMLEHADGSGKPGTIIQYNCDDFDCEPDLVKKLTNLAQQYPDNVYLAPNNYDGKIILTKLNRRKVLENPDDSAIRDFIEQ